MSTVSWTQGTTCTLMCHGSLELMSETDTEEKKLLNKVIILVFFAHKVFS